MKSLYPLCPFCKADKTCVRHLEKGVQKINKMNAIPKVSAKKKAAMPKDKARKKELTEFYDIALSQAPLSCEECGDLLVKSTVINPRVIIAHLLSKRENHGFPSVATNQDNKAYLCAYCHNGLDFKGAEYVTKMKIYPLILKRVAMLLPHLTPEELKRVPEYLLKRTITEKCQKPKN